MVTDQTMQPISLTVAHVAASYGARVVMQDITLTLHQGEILVVSGHNGSGKSTLLRLLCGLQKPTSGTIYYTWHNQQLPPQAASHLIGWISPDLALYRALTAYENLRFFAAVRGLPVSQAHLDTLLDTVGLQGRGEDRIACYSSGMMHRLRYAYALLHQPPILLLDEPTVTLDEQGAERVERIVQQQRKQGLTIIATNDPREYRFADYILTLGAA
jgi:heme exporter protein A